MTARPPGGESAHLIKNIGFDLSTRRRADRTAIEGCPLIVDDGSLFIVRRSLYNLGMRTPYGQECPYYYADYHRGRNEELCRLVEASTVSEPWIPDVCKDCPVPAIVRANACEHMTLQARVAKGFLGFGRKVVVEAYCVKAQRRVDEPQIGCGQCHGDAKIADLFNE